MAGSLGDLLLTLRADFAQFKSDLGKATVAAETNAKAIENEYRKSASNLKSLASTIATGFVGKFVLDLIEAGDNIGKLAGRAGIDTKTFQELAYAAKLADVDVSSLGESINKMQRTLGEGSKSTTEALNALGLSLPEIQKMSADKALETIAEQISLLENPADRVRAAVDLFGKSGASLLPLFEGGAKGIASARKEANALGAVLSKDKIETLQRYDDFIKKATISTKAFFAEILLFTTTDAEKVGTWFQQLKRTVDGSGWDFSPRATLKFRIENLKNDKFLDPAERAKLLKAAQEELAALPEEAQAGSGSVRGVINRGTPKKPPGYGALPTPEQIAAAKAWQKILDDVTKANNAFNNSLQEGANAIGADIGSKQIEQMREELDMRYEAIQAIKDERAALVANAVALTQTPVEEITARYRELTAAIRETMATLPEESARFQELQVLLGKVAKKQQEEITAAGVTLSTYGEQAARNMQDAFAQFLFDPFKGGLKGMLRAFIDTLRQMVAQAAAAKVFEAIGMGSGGKGGIFTTIAAAIFGGGRAKGGSVSSSKGYIVGENGPEFFQPNISGSIIPNMKGKMGMAAQQESANRNVVVSPVYNIDARGATQELVRVLPGLLDATTKRAVELAKASIYDDLSRGAMGRG
ncbi:hypothetical protein UFOVP605_55 [uncultured Caudovirales phage]|uniref:Bacteriophage lambda, GpH, tail tape measure, C-terminal n=1 Tax=uncultured Caudovirales phage TaxID=2100421 RepID=A0A6J5N5F2_9CAUD|nr:hypothetical protein UFOVP605_55 [uncultured Caudovirales phage]